MEEFVGEALASGNYEVESEVFFEKKVALKKSHAVKVDAEEFPAQEVLIAQQYPPASRLERNPLRPAGRLFGQGQGPGEP